MADLWANRSGAGVFTDGYGELMKSKTQLPGGWKVVPLANVAEIVMGQSPPGSTVSEWEGDSRVDTGLPFIQGNAEFGDMFPQPTKWCGRPVKIAERGDTLISVRAPVGEVNRASERTAIGRGLAAIRFTSADSHFGWHIVNHAKHEFDRVTQGSTFQAIGGNELRSLSVFLPPLAEQRAIATVLDSIDEAIERTDAVIAATERLRDSLLHELLTRGVPGWHSEWKEAPGIGTIPACWEVVRLEDVAELVMGQSPPGSTVSNWDGDSRGDTGLPFMQGNAEFGEMFPQPAKWCDSPMKVAERGDTLISVRAPVGEVNLADDRLAIGRGLAAIRFTAIDSRFGWHIVNYAKHKFDRLTQGSTFQAIGRSELRSLSVLLPHIPEQRAIAAMLNGVDDAIDGLREELDSLQTTKASTADALLAGRVRVGGINA